MSNSDSRAEFLTSFYGEKFFREFGQGLSSYRTPCTSSRELEVKINFNERKKRSCVASIYNYSAIQPINPKMNIPREYEKYVIIDRICFDLDRNLPHRIKKNIRKAPHHSDVVETFNSLLNEQEWALPPIEEAKVVAQYIREIYGKETFMVFSGAKGAHIYLFFSPVDLKNPTGVIRIFQERLRDNLNLNYVDNQIIGDVARLLRIPYTIHPDSGLKVVPFNITMDYQEIIMKASETSLKPINFDVNGYLIPIERILKKIDREIDQELLQQKSVYENRFRNEFKYSQAKKGRITINTIEDALKLLNFPCFQSTTDYTGDKGHSQRWAIGIILFWSGMKLTDIVNFFKNLVNDFDEKITTYQLKHMLGGDGLPKYVITCRYMKNRGICKNCGRKFYAKIRLRQEYWQKMNNMVNN